MIFVKLTNKKVKKKVINIDSHYHEIKDNGFFNHKNDSIVFFHIQKTSGTLWVD